MNKKNPEKNPKKTPKPNQPIDQKKKTQISINISYFYVYVL